MTPVTYYASSRPIEAEDFAFLVEDLGDGSGHYTSCQVVRVTDHRISVRFPDGHVRALSHRNAFTYGGQDAAEDFG